MNDRLRDELARTLSSDTSLPRIVDRLRDYRDRGIPREEVQSVLEDLRREAPDEEAEDRILEVLDFVVGFCSPQMRVWPD